MPFTFFLFFLFSRQTKAVIPLAARSRLLPPRLVKNVHNMCYVYICLCICPMCIYVHRRITETQDPGCLFGVDPRIQVIRGSNILARRGSMDQLCNIHIRAPNCPPWKHRKKFFEWLPVTHRTLRTHAGYLWLIVLCEPTLTTCASTTFKIPTLKSCGYLWFTVSVYKGIVFCTSVLVWYL